MLVLLGCDGPTKPSASAATAPATASASAAPLILVLKEIVIEGPETIAPLATGRFTARGIGFDGTSQDLTSKVTWSATGLSAQGAIAASQALRMSGSGEATGIAPGEASVRATLSGLSSNARAVMVLDPGTYRVTGMMSESQEPVPSGTVEVISGTRAGLKVTTTQGGQYALYGLAGTVVLRASALGYEPQDHTISIPGQTVENFVLQPVAPLFNLTGDWDVTVGAPSACRGVLDPSLLERHQIATITWNGTRFDLVTPLMAQLGIAAHGRLFGGNMTLGLGPDDNWDYALWDEHVGDLELWLWGNATGTASADGVRGSYDGYVFVKPTSSSAQISCRGSDGTFSLTHRK